MKPRPSYLAAGTFFAAVVAAQSANASPPPDGSETETIFCGTVYESTLGLSAVGLAPDTPYVGTLTLTQRPPDTLQESVPGQGVDITQWECGDGNPPCGEFRLVIPGFVPPQTAPDSSDVFGPVEDVNQTGNSYRVNANLDDFVTGPANLGAIGIAQLTLVCPECALPNDIYDIRPNFGENLVPISGNIVMQLQVPGIGGSLSPPEGSNQDVRLSIIAMGPHCHRLLPATSTPGLVALVALMVATAIFFARGERAHS